VKRKVTVIILALIFGGTICFAPFVAHRDKIETNGPTFNIVDTYVNGSDGESLGYSDEVLPFTEVRYAGRRTRAPSFVGQLVYEVPPQPEDEISSEVSPQPEEPEIEEPEESTSSPSYGAPCGIPRGSSSFIGTIIWSFVDILVGSANAQTGDAAAIGNSSLTDIGCCGDTCAGSASLVGIDVENNGNANAESGDALAIGVLAQNLINNNLLLNFGVSVLGENTSSNIFVNVAYNIVTALVGSANAQTGDAAAIGNSSLTDIESDSTACTQVEGGDGEGCCGDTCAGSASLVGIDVENNGNANAKRRCLGHWSSCPKSYQQRIDFKYPW